MDLLRRLFGKSSDDATRDGSRRASHVTPSRTQRVVMPLREAPPEQAETEAPPETPAEDASGAEAEAEITAPQSADERPATEPEQAMETPAPAEPEEDEAPPKADAEATQAAEADSTAIPAPKPILTRQRHALSYGIASDVGIVRDNNEDACFGMGWQSLTVDERPDFGLFIVADGMGGHLDGERASGVAVQTLAAEMLDSIYVPMLKDFNSGSNPTILEALIQATERANRAVIERVPGGGTTLSAVAIVGNLAYLVHVGDSRAYLLHEDKIEQLTTDHTLVQRLIEMKELTRQEAEHYPQKNVLYRAIGQNEQLKLERMVRTLPPGAQVLLCTDGLWDLVDDARLLATAAEARSPQEACDRLIRLANERGGADNVSVIICKTPSD